MKHNYTFNVGRAVKLNIETGINILDGDLVALQLTNEYTNYVEENDGSTDVEKILHADKLKNKITMQEFKYAKYIIPYFCDDNIDVEELTFDELMDFYDQFKKVHASAFRGQKSTDTGK